LKKIDEKGVLKAARIARDALLLRLRACAWLLWIPYYLIDYVAEGISFRVERKIAVNALIANEIFRRLDLERIYVLNSKILKHKRSYGIIGGHSFEAIAEPQYLDAEYILYGFLDLRRSIEVKLSELESKSSEEGSKFSTISSLLASVFLPPLALLHGVAGEGLEKRSKLWLIKMILDQLGIRPETQHYIVLGKELIYFPVVVVKTFYQRGSISFSRYQVVDLVEMKIDTLLTELITRFNFVKEIIESVLQQATPLEL